MEKRPTKNKFYWFFFLFQIESIFILEKFGNLNQGKTLQSESYSLGFSCQDFLCIHNDICVTGNYVKLSLIFCRLYFSIHNKV